MRGVGLRSLGGVGNLEVLQGRERSYYEIMWNGRRIWGATAAIIVNLSRRLQWG